MENRIPWSNDSGNSDYCRREDRVVDDGSVYRYCDGHLNFATANHEDDDFYHKRKLARDPMSHRIIEKRRRDRMNNCLADLSRLIPADYLKKGRGRIEKTEIIEMAIKHMRHLQTIIATNRVTGDFEKPSSPTRQPINMEHYRLGYYECVSEAMHFLVEIQGFFSGDNLCVQMMNHLHRHCDAISKRDSLNFPRQHNGENSTSSSNSSSSNATGGSPPLGMSSSMGSHSDEHCEYPAGCSESDESQYLHRNYSSSSGVESLDVKEEPEGPSQLRDMLMSSGSRKSDSGYDLSGGEEHHMYKFKNTIQQRYNESRLHDVDGPPLKKPKIEDQQLLGGGKLSFGHKALVVKPIPLLSTSKAHHDQKSPGVPVFALHANGEFYIPLTLDPHLLSQHLPALTDKPPHKAALHPVTISVNFQQQARLDSRP